MNEVLIKDYLFFQEGPGVRNNQYTNTGVKLLNVSNLVDGKLDLSNSSRYISNEEAYGRYNHFLCDEGDLIIASSGIKVDYFDKKIGFIKKEMLPLCMNTSTIRFKVLDKEKLDINYFYYYLKSNHFKNQLSKNITGSAQLNFGPSHLKQMKFIICDIDEQRTISNRLDIINRGIESKKNQIQKLEELIKSQFIEMFDDPRSNDKNWVKSNMGDYMTVLTDFSSNGSYQTLDSKVRMYDEPDYAYMVRTTDLENNDFKNNVKYISEDVYKFLSKSKVYPNDIIMNKIGSAGKVYIMPDVGMPVSLGRNAFLFRYNKKINTIFIYYLLISDYGINEISQYVRGAVTKTITKDDVRKIKIIVPPIELQNKFAKFVEKVNKQKSEFEESLKKIEELKAALMQEYFG